MINKLINDHYFSDQLISSLIPAVVESKKMDSFDTHREMDVIKKLVSSLINKYQISYKNISYNLRSYKQLISQLDTLQIEKQLLLSYLSCLNSPLKSLGSLSPTNEALATYIHSIAPKERQILEKYFITKNFDLLINRIQKLKSYN